MELLHNPLETSRVEHEITFKPYTRRVCVNVENRDTAWHHGARGLKQALIFRIASPLAFQFQQRKNLWIRPTQITAWMQLYLESSVPERTNVSDVQSQFIVDLPLPSLKASNNILWLYLIYSVVSATARSEFQHRAFNYANRRIRCKISPNAAAPIAQERSVRGWVAVWLAIVGTPCVVSRSKG